MGFWFFSALFFSFFALPLGVFLDMRIVRGMLRVLAVIPATGAIVKLEEGKWWLLPVALTFLQTFGQESLLCSLW